MAKKKPAMKEPIEVINFSLKKKFEEFISNYDSQIATILIEFKKGFFESIDINESLKVDARTIPMAADQRAMAPAYQFDPVPYLFTIICGDRRICLIPTARSESWYRTDVPNHFIHVLHFIGCEVNQTLYISDKDAYEFGLYIGKSIAKPVVMYTAQVNSIRDSLNQCIY